MIPASRLVEEARKFIGAKWRHCGRKPWAMDCIGLVILSANNAGLDLCKATGVEDPKVYSREANILTLQMLQSIFIQVEEPIEGCVAFIKFPLDSLPRHFGIITAEHTIIHANGLHNKVMEHGFRHPWPQWTHSFWKLPGVEYA